MADCDEEVNDPGADVFVAGAMRGKNTEPIPELQQMLQQQQEIMKCLREQQAQLQEQQEQVAVLMKPLLNEGPRVASNDKGTKPWSKKPFVCL